MICDEVRELLPSYWDLPEKDALRLAVDDHVDGCQACREEFVFWEQSVQLMHSESEEIPEEYAGNEAVSVLVMNRIYNDESWRLPVQQRMYAISDKLRRNMMICIAFCLALFVGSFLYALIGGETPSNAASTDNSVFTIQTPQKLDAGSDKLTPAYNMKTAVASVSQTFVEPIPFQMGPIHSYSNFLLIVSIIGFIGAMLVLNWINRVKT